MIIKVFPDKERVKSMLKLIENRERFVSSVNINEFSTIIAEIYYEIIKELATSLLLLDGLKTIGENSHKETIENLANHKEFSEEDIVLINDLRIKRNKSSYEGKPIDKIYIENKKDNFILIIKKLKKLIKIKLKE